MMKQFFRRALALALCLALLGCPAALALEYTEVTWVTDAGDDVIDSLYGIDAHFSSYNCWEYVKRFFEEGFGVTLQATRGMPAFLSGGEGKWFVEIADDASPRTGDILFGTSAMRGSNDHYALVKSYDPATGEITVIEQNFKWNGQSAKDRKIPWPSTAYNCYRLMDETGPVVPAAEIPDDPAADPPSDEAPAPVNLSNITYSAWAEETIVRATQLGISELLPDYTAETSREAFCGMALHTLQLLGVSPEVVRLCPPEQDTGYAAAAYEIGLIDGDSNGDLTPDALLTRQQASKILSRVFDQVGALPEVEPEILKVYRDAERIAGWAEPFVASMTACGVIQGMRVDGALCFAPDDSLTLEMALTLLLRLYDNPAPSVSVFYEP